jgi:hypothetical protein
MSVNIIIFIIIGTFLMVPLSSVSACYYIFYYKNYLVWKDIYTHAADCELLYDIGWAAAYKYKQYKILLWGDSKTASIHLLGKGCVFSTHDLKRSKALYKAIQESQL